jgi:hypothetical protein
MPFLHLKLDMHHSTKVKRHVLVAKVVIEIIGLCTRLRSSYLDKLLEDVIGMRNNTMTHNTSNNEQNIPSIDAFGTNHFVFVCKMVHVVAGSLERLLPFHVYYQLKRSNYVVAGFKVRRGSNSNRGIKVMSNDFDGIAWGLG